MYIFDPKACQWNDQVIFMLNLKGIFNVYLLNDATATPADKVKLLVPIQKLPKHGHHHIIQFMPFDNQIYCLLGSTHLDENRLNSHNCQEQNSPLEMMRFDAR